MVDGRIVGNPLRFTIEAINISTFETSSKLLKLKTPAYLSRFFPLSNLGSLQLFQLARYAVLVLVGVGFAKLHLSQTDIGNFETFLLTSGMLSFFWVSGTINSMLAVYPKQTEQGQKKLLFNTFVSLSFYGCIAAVLLFLFSQNILSFLDKSDNQSIISLSVIYLLLNSPSFLIEYILFLNGKKEQIIYYALASSTLTILAVLVPVLLSCPIAYSIYGMIAVAVIKMLLILFLLNRYAAFEFDYRFVVENLQLSLPLMLSIFVSGSAEYIDGIIVKSKFDNVAFAVFRYGAKELPILLIIANTFSTAMIPAISKNLNEGLAEIKRNSAQLMHLFFPLSLGLLIFSQLIYRYVFNDSFVYSALIFNFYLLLVIPRVLFPQSILTGLGKTKFLLLSAIIEIVINVSLSIYLADKIGLPGVALGTFIAYSVDKIFLMAISRFIYGIRISSYLQIIPFLVYSSLTLFVFAMSYVMMLRGVWNP